MQQRKDYRRVPNFNLVPLEHRKPTVSFRRLSLRFLLVIVIVAEAFLIRNLNQQKSSLEAAIDTAQRKMQQIDKEIAIIANVQGKDAATLEAALKALRERVGGLDKDWKALGMEQPNWSAVIAIFYQSKPGGVQLTSLNQSAERVTATGTASDYRTLLDYYYGILASPLISQITLLKSASAGSSVSFSLEVVVRMTGK
ncbi:MAG: PilN domain-containing protein [Dehalococcoidia bacterium]|nr:PilN domain-containing protein [Dehalococcoidia bacterium]